MGLKGALASISDTGMIHQATKMPLNDAGEVDAYMVMQWIGSEAEDAQNAGESMTISTENLHAIFGTSAASNFSFAYGIGKVHGVLECLEVPVNKVKPREWQEFIFAVTDTPEMTKLIKGKQKRQTKAMAEWAVSILWPEQSINHDGINDALLIAEYSRRSSQGSKVVQ
jgi:hypothetical protein